MMSGRAQSYCFLEPARQVARGRVCHSNTPKIFSPFGSHSRPYRLPCHDEMVIGERISVKQKTGKVWG